MAEQANPVGRIRGWFKALMAAAVGLVGGSVATYGTAIVNTVVHPSKPVANFAVTADGLTVTCQSHATGETGWWDFGDGTPLEPFDANQPSLAHTYAKPGTFPVKLTVRNFLSEENERTVPVDLTVPPQTLPPSVAVRVESISPRAVAPATFRVKGEAKNVERALLDLGERVEVSTETGPFERLVVFEKPGNYPIQLIGYSGKNAVKEGATVRVEAPAANSLSVIVRVIDSGTRTDRMDIPMMVPVPSPKTAGKGFTKVVAARPGFVVTAAKAGTLPPTVRNVQVFPTPDKKGAQITGEWVSVQKAGGSDPIIPVVLTEEQTAPMTAPPSTVAAALVPGTGGLTAMVSMPPRPLGMANPQRRMSIEIRQASADGRSVPLMTVADAKLPLSTQISGAQPIPVQVEQVGEQLKVTVRATY